MDSDDQYDEEELHSFLLTEIRSNLNLDSETLEESWKSFRSISVKYILEVRIQNYSMILLIIYFHCLKRGIRWIGLLVHCTFLVENVVHKRVVDKLVSKAIWSL